MYIIMHTNRPQTTKVSREETFEGLLLTYGLQDKKKQLGKTFTVPWKTTKIFFLKTFVFKVSNISIYVPCTHYASKICSISKISTLKFSG